MNRALLSRLRCAYCGTRFAFTAPSCPLNEKTTTGLLACECGVFPVVEDIPVLYRCPEGELAAALLEEGNAGSALEALLGLDELAAPAFRRMLAGGPTFRRALEILAPDAEGTYLFYRFSDPTFRATRALAAAVARETSGPILDLCGGAGHLTRTLGWAGGGAPVLLADFSYWKLWLAKRFVAPTCQPVCCDAALPLPLSDEPFALLLCSDAFHYVAAKRTLAGEMVRLAGEKGILLLPHVHSALGENPSAGYPLSPAAYRALFHGLNPRLFSDRALAQAAARGEPLDLAAGQSDHDLAGAPALVIAASRDERAFRLYPQFERVDGEGVLAVNPLYEVAARDGGLLLALHFPSDAYEREFGACRAYLPEEVRLAPAQVERLQAGCLDAELECLLERGVLLDLPEAYL